jgi:cysteinyl-tRNA synthetase
LEYFYETLKRAEDLLQGADMADSAVAVDALKKVAVSKSFVKVMDDDFNTAKALADIGEGMRVVNELADMKAKKIKKLEGGRPAWLATIRELAAELGEALGVLGLCTMVPNEALGQLRDFSVAKLGLDTALIEAKIVEREDARKAKDWARSDSVRDELVEMGVELRDSPTGTTWKVVR